MDSATFPIEQLWQSAFEAHDLKRNDPDAREMVDNVMQHWGSPAANADNHDSLVDDLEAEVNKFKEFRSFKNIS